MKIREPLSLSEGHGIDPAALESAGVLDVTMNVDTRLFIDPLLLSVSAHPEMRTARKTFDHHFSMVIKLLAASMSPGDVAMRNAKNFLEFHEVRGTCLGYSGASNNGSGFGEKLTNEVLSTAREIVRLGVSDPDLFLVLAIFEDGIGADRISDMTTRVILTNLLAFNERVLKTLNIERKVPFPFEAKTFRLVENLSDPKRGPIFLVPTDVLRALPIANDWDDVSRVAAENATLRKSLNDEISKLWQQRARQAKREVRKAVFTSKQAFEAFLEVLKSMDKSHYDLIDDPGGFVSWKSQIRTSALPVDAKLSKLAATKLSVEDVRTAVNLIVENFKSMVEDKGLWKIFWSARKHRPEKNAQLVFFAIADSYCRAYNLDLTAEADSGNGPVDFKVSSGYDKRVLIEIKLSTNQKIVSGYAKQIERYKLGEDTEHAIYLVIDLERSAAKAERLLKERNRMLGAGLRPSSIVFVDARIRASASKE